MNKRILIPLVLLAAFLVAPAMAAPAEHSVTAGGWIIDRYGQKVTFGVKADSNLKGEWEVSVTGSTYLDKWMAHSISIDGFYTSGNYAVIWGLCRLKYAGTSGWDTYEYYIKFEDNGPGTLDRIVINWHDSAWTIWYDSDWQYLSGGNIQLK